MKIHTTQNLSPLSTNQSTCENLTKGQRFRNLDDIYLEHSMDNMSNAIADKSNVSFQGKKSLITSLEDFVKRKAANGGKGKGSGGGFFAKIWKKICNAVSKMTDKMFASKKFDKILDAMKNEVLVQAGIALVICAGLRPLTILALPDKNKDKNDNKYAAGHAICSGIMGFIAPLLLVTPFVNGAKKASKDWFKYFTPETLKERHPNVDLKTAVDKATGKIVKDGKGILDLHGNPFSTDYKDVMKIADPTHISKVSDETLKALGVNIEKNGKDLTKHINDLKLKDIFVAVEEEGMGINKFSLQHMHDDFFKEVFKDVELSSTVGKNGERLHPKFWKKAGTGETYKLDPQSVFISSYRETDRAIPLITGETRIDTLDKDTIKYVTYQKNVKELNPDGTEKLGVPGKLGSPILQKYLEADAVNTVFDKIVQWLPDILTRFFVASATIKLLPFVLKNVFGLEKTKKPPVQTQEQITEVKTNDNKEIVSTSRKEVA